MLSAEGDSFPQVIRSSKINLSAVELRTSRGRGTALNPSSPGVTVLAKNSERLKTRDAMCITGLHLAVTNEINK